MLVAKDIVKTFAGEAGNAPALRGVSLEGIAWVDDAAELATRDDVDVVVELIGGSDGPALTLARRHTTRIADAAEFGAMLMGVPGTNQARRTFDFATSDERVLEPAELDVHRHGLALLNEPRYAPVPPAAGPRVRRCPGRARSCEAWGCSGWRRPGRTCRSL